MQKLGFLTVCMLLLTTMGQATHETGDYWEEVTGPGPEGSSWFRSFREFDRIAVDDEWVVLGATDGPDSQGRNTGAAFAIDLTDLDDGWIDLTPSGLERGSRSYAPYSFSMDADNGHALFYSAEGVFAYRLGSSASAQVISGGETVGLHLDVHGNSAFLGEPGADDGPLENVGVVHELQYRSGDWETVGTIAPPTPVEGLWFGQPVTNGAWLAVASHNDGSSQASEEALTEIFLYQNIDDEWTYQQSIKPAGNTSLPYDDLTFDGNKLAVGSAQHDGSVWQYSLDDGIWELDWMQTGAATGSNYADSKLALQFHNGVVAHSSKSGGAATYTTTGSASITLPSGVTFGPTWMVDDGPIAFGWRSQDNGWGALHIARTGPIPHETTSSSTSTSSTSGTSSSSTSSSTAPRDTDGDGRPDTVDSDDDNDGLNDTDEIKNGTNPLLSDTDGDGYSDLIELQLKTDPTDKESHPSGVQALEPRKSNAASAATLIAMIVAVAVIFVMFLLLSLRKRKHKPMAPTTPTTNAGLSVEDVSVAYGTKKVLKHLTFHCPPGKTSAILGPSGGGKTTLLKAILGELPYSGTISAKGDALDSADIAFVAQQTELYDRLNAKENIAYFGKQAGLTGKEANREAQDILNKLGLGPAALQRVSELSGGQKRRVSIGAALITKPKTLILDEPTAGLDYESRMSLMALLHQLAHEFGTTTLLTTHFLDEADLAEHVVIMANGRTIREGSPQDLQKYVPGGGQVVHMVLDGKTIGKVKAIEAILKEAKEDGTLSTYVRRGTNIRMYGKKPENIIAALPAAFAKEGLQVASVSRRSAAVEDIYVVLVGSVRGVA